MPSNRLEVAFDHHYRRWVPRPHLTRSVILRPPTTPVNLLTVRSTDATTEPKWASVKPALDCVRKHGRVLFDAPPPPGVLDRVRFRPMQDSRRVFERTAEPAPTGNAGTYPENANYPPTTLADRLEQYRLIDSHQNLARSLARRFSRYGDAEDLEQVAIMALIRAAGRFRAEKGFAFATYATASILGELKRHFRDRTWAMRVPRSVQETYLAVEKARDVLGQQPAASPTVQQIAEHLGTSDEAVLMAMEAGENYSPASLDVPSSDGKYGSIEPAVEEPGLDLTLDRRQLELALPKLDKQELYLIKRLYFDGCTQKHVAAEIGVSQMQVSRLAARMLAKLRAEFQVAG